MNLKYCLLILALGIPLAHAEEHAAEQAKQELVELQIGALGELSVKHVVRDSDMSRELELVGGTTHNITVLDEHGGEIAFAMTGNGRGVLLPASEEPIIIQYDLLDELELVDGVWTLEFSYPETTSVLMPDGPGLIFVNGNPVSLGDKPGIKCHGCSMLLEYILDEPSIFERVTWEEHEFLVEIRTLSETGMLEFDQPGRGIGLDIHEGGRFVTVVIPVELLGNPYSVFLDGEKIRFHEYISNGTHVWLNARPDSAGRMDIIGTSVIPEFTIMIPLAAGLAAAAVLSRMRLSIPR